MTVEANTLVLALIPAAYQLLAIAASIAQLRRKRPVAGPWPAVSILKPSPPGEWPPADALASHRAQDYSAEFEICAGPGARVDTPNRKVGKLIHLEHDAQHGVLIVNDADIVVPPDYLRDVAAHLAQPGVGIVTALYRAKGDSMASEFEALGIASDFMPSVLVARLIGIREFGLGATLAFRREHLKRIGGFEAVADYIADDYQLAKKITASCGRAELATVVVETGVSGDWTAVWRHQVRWARTIRCSRTGPYFGLPVAQAGVWAAALAMVPGGAPVAAAVCALRIAMAWISGVRVIGSAAASRWFWLAPVWDLFAFAVWIAGWTSNVVEWRGERMRLDREGRIRR